jgi:hypothetical protein
MYLNYEHYVLCNSYTYYDISVIQLDFKPADIKHSSLRTMAKHVRRAMLPGNHEVFQRSFAEGNLFPQLPTLLLLSLKLHLAALQR